MRETEHSEDNYRLVYGSRRFSLGFLRALSAPSLGRLQKVFALLLLGGLLLFGFVAIYSEVAGQKRSFSYSNWGKPTSFKWTINSKKDNQEENSESWRVDFAPQPWKPEYMGQANLHVFEEWCGSSTDELRENVHYPLHPHIRTTVDKLAVAPEQTNYGLRIFGYLHPHTDGEYVFALSSDDNSELWLSTDESPLNLRSLAWVGKTGAEWTAPGEFDKFLFQTSMPIRLSAQTRYFFEVILKQNAKGIDHVAVAWQLLDQDQKFVIIQSEHISLYVNESTLAMGEVAHIPQTAASHKQSHAPSSAADMQKEDPRDTFYHVPIINNTFVTGLLPDCIYKPSYTIKGYRLQRYQGLKFVHLSYIYPNDHTRLTHMDTENTCYYVFKPHLFNNYMSKDSSEPAVQKVERGTIQNNPQAMKSNLLFLNYEDEDGGFTLRRTLSLDDNNGTNLEQINKPTRTQDKEVAQVKPKSKKRKRSLSHQVILKKRQIQRSEPDHRSLKEWGIVQNSPPRSPPRSPPISPPRSPPKLKWTQTFNINRLGFQGQKSHNLNMDCRVTGNILLQETEVQIIVESFMEKFNEKHSGLFTLERVVNVVMNADFQNGKRYLLELELKDQTGKLWRLSQYIYALKNANTPPNQPKLCNPVGFKWNPQATVHIIVPVKNQARWVHLLIEDIERLARETGDTNFNLVLTDFSSTDMNIEQALAKSKIPRYQYKKLTGNFERSRGLQEGINLIEDPHSIMFLFDLHIRFPSSFIDIIRKHCIEGYQAFAPIVMRLECGATTSEAKGLWEVQGFGLLGIYKSDIKLVGGMNTREFKDHWGGEDWELLDRILVAGLEVERFYMRNFFHHFHSKRGMWLANKG